MSCLVTYKQCRVVQPGNPEREQLACSYYLKEFYTTKTRVQHLCFMVEQKRPKGLFCRAPSPLPLPVSPKNPSLWRLPLRGVEPGLGRKETEHMAHLTHGAGRAWGSLDLGNLFQIRLLHLRKLIRKVKRSSSFKHVETRSQNLRFLLVNYPPASPNPSLQGST